jgi:hypothetical protein
VASKSRAIRSCAKGNTDACTCTCASRTTLSAILPCNLFRKWVQRREWRSVEPAPPRRHACQRCPACTLGLQKKCAQEKLRWRTVPCRHLSRRALDHPLPTYKRADPTMPADTALSTCRDSDILALRQSIMLNPKSTKKSPVSSHRGRV